MGAPLTVGYGEGENYLGSDAIAVAPWTQRIAYLDEGDWAVVRRDGIQIFDRDNRPVEREIVESGASSAPVEKGNYRHYMQKEIFEQPIVVAQTLQTYVRPFEGEVALPVADADLAVGQSPDDRRLRHQLLRRSRRQILDRAIRARSGRHRCRERVPIPRAGARAGRAGALHQPVRRDRGYARGTPPRQGAAAADRGGGQRADQLHGARGGPAASRPMPARRSASPRPRRSHASLPSLRRSPRTWPGPRAGSTREEEKDDRRAPAGGAGRPQRCAQPRRRHRRDGAPHRAGARRPLSRPRARLSRWRSKAR